MIFRLASTLTFSILVLNNGIASEQSDLENRLACEKLPEEKRPELKKKANCFFKAKLYEQSVLYLRKITTLFPRDVEAYALTSFALWTQANDSSGDEKDSLIEKAKEELNRASVLNPSHWKVFMEIGDFYYLRLNSPERSIKHYIRAQELYEGDKAQNVPPASSGQKAAIENRIARNNEELVRLGEAVSSSCLALQWDPDNKEAQDRLTKLAGSCKRKNFRTHITGKTKTNETKSSHHEEAAGHH